MHEHNVLFKNRGCLIEMPEWIKNLWFHMLSKNVVRLLSIQNQLSNCLKYLPSIKM